MTRARKTSAGAGASAGAKKAGAAGASAGAGAGARKAGAGAAGAGAKKAGATGAGALYVYALVKSARAVVLVKGPAGLVGAGKPRVLEVGDGWSAIVADVPLKLYSAEAVDAKLRDLDWVSSRAGEHDAVVEHALELGTVVPLKLFTMFASDDRAEAHVRRSRRSLDRVAERIGGCEEWGLRVLLDEKRARAAAAQPTPKKKISGTSFLERKKAIEDVRKKTGERGAVEASELFDALSALAKKAQRRPAPNRDLAARVFLDAVFLVPRAKVTKLKDAVRKAAPALVDAGFDITLSGPWPAYSFIGAT